MRLFFSSAFTKHPTYSVLDHIVPWYYPLGLGMGRIRWYPRNAALYDRSSRPCGRLAYYFPSRRIRAHHAIPCLQHTLLHRCAGDSSWMDTLVVRYLQIRSDVRCRRQHRVESYRKRPDPGSHWATPGTCGQDQGAQRRPTGGFINSRRNYRG